LGCRFSSPTGKEKEKDKEKEKEKETPSSAKRGSKGGRAKGKGTVCTLGLFIWQNTINHSLVADIVLQAKARKNPVQPLRSLLHRARAVL
jgi:hypothetical protein